MLAESHDEEQIIARVAALDIGKAELVCCVRLPAQRGPKRLQEVSTHSTMTRSLTELASRLVELGVQRVVMEATSDYWKPVFYLLEAHGLDPWLVNARDVKHLPGRPKSDVIDAVWLCKLAERQMLRPSFVPPWPIRRLRDLTRYRVDLVAARTAEKNRVEKLLEDACIKLSVVASDIFGVSGRAMMAALIAGERDPHVLAQMARARMRTKIARLEQAFNGHFDDHHRFLLARMLDRIDSTEADIAALDNQIQAHLVPFAAAAARLDEIPGIGAVAAAVIVAEVGVDMSRFPTAGHLCSWAKLSPGLNTSAGKTKGNGSTGHGNRYLAGILGEAAVWPAEPIPSSVPGIGASPNGEVTNAPSSRSGARSSGTCSPATTRGSQISEPTTSPNTSTRMPRNATTSANWKPSATPSPLPRPPESPPKSTPDQRRPVTPTRPHPTAGHHHFPVRSGRSGRKSSGFTLQFRRPEHPGVSSSSSIQRESGNRAELPNDTVLPPEGFAVERLSSDRVDVAPYGKELSRSPEGDQDRVGIQARVRSRVRDELAACGPYGQHQRPVRQPKRRIGQTPTDQRRGGSDLDFLDSVIESLVVHDDVKELGHVRLQRKRRHPPPADQLRVDGPVSAGPQRTSTPPCEHGR